MAKATAKITGAKVLAALGDGTVDPREIVRLVTTAFEVVEKVTAENAARDKAKAEADAIAERNRRLVASKKKERDTEIAELRRKQNEELEAVDGTAQRKLSARLKDIAVNHADKHAPPDDSPTIMET